MRFAIGECRAYRRIVGKGLAERLVVCLTHHTERETLRSLHQSIVCTLNIAFAYMIQCVYYRHYWNAHVVHTCTGKATLYKVDGEQGSHTVVNAHHTTFVVGNHCKSVSYRLVSCIATIGDTHIHVERMFLA